MTTNVVYEDPSLLSYENTYHREQFMRRERRQNKNTRVAILLLTPFLILLIAFWLFAIARAKSIFSQARNIAILQIANIIMVGIDLASAPSEQKESQVVRPATNDVLSDNTSETDDQHSSSDHQDVELHSLLVQQNHV